MKILALIPARMASSRFPGKPLALINGKAMIEHVYERVKKSNLVSLTAIATCDQLIYDHVTSVGGLAVMTDIKHERASDRCGEALLKIEKDQGHKFDIVLMVQGDEPMVEPEMIAESIKPMIADPTIQVLNLMAKLNIDSELEDRNCIKVVCDVNSDALYFSRQPIPTRANKDANNYWKQVCIIPFKRDYLLKYIEMKPTPLEIAESVDMMRVLENGDKVRMAVTEFQTQSVDTESDLKRVELLMKKNQI